MIDLQHRFQSEAFSVLLVFGFILGGIAAVCEVLGVSSEGVLDVLKQVYALSIFSVLTILGFSMLLLSELLSGNHPRCAHKMRVAGCPPLRVGLAMCFSASGATIGASAAAMIVFYLFGSDQQSVDALKLLVVGGLLLFVGWGMLFAGMAFSDSMPQWMSILGMVYTATIAIVLFNYARDGFYQLVACLLVAGLLGHVLARIKKRRATAAQQIVEGDL